MEVLYEGWLTKSPPESQTKRTFLKAKWRRRYFVLHEPCAADSYPGVRAALRYYKNDSQKDLLGCIDLTACETVDSSLRSDVYRHLFSLRTKHKGRDRTYYLAAPTDADMNNWVDCLCQALGLKENNDDKPPDGPVATTTTRQPPPAHRPMLPSHDTVPSSISSSRSDVSQPYQPERRNSQQESYLHLDQCYSNPPPVSSSSSAALNQVPPAPHVRLTTTKHTGGSSHSIPDDAPPPPPKTGTPRNIPGGGVGVGSSVYDCPGGRQSQLYDSPPQTTYQDPKLNYINLDAFAQDNDDDGDDGTYKYPDSNDNVYKVPPSRVDTESLYKVPPVNHLKFMGRGNESTSIYSVPPSSSGQNYDPGVYDVPPTAKALRDSNSSTDDSGIHTGDQGGVQRLTSMLMSSQLGRESEIYDHPPPTEPRDVLYDQPPHKRVVVDIYDQPPPGTGLKSSRGAAPKDMIYDQPPPFSSSSSLLHSRPQMSPDLNDVVPVPRPCRKLSEGSINTGGSGTAYINIQSPRSPPSQYIVGAGTVPRQRSQHHPSHHPAPPSLPPLHASLDDVYDFPRSGSVPHVTTGGHGHGHGHGHNDLDAMPPAPNPHGTPGGSSIHRYANAPSAVVPSASMNTGSNQELYMPMGAPAVVSSHEQLDYIPMGGGVGGGGMSASSPPGQESYMPMRSGGRMSVGDSSIGSRISTDSTYTVMVPGMPDDEQPLPPPMMNKSVPPPLIIRTKEAMELGITKTTRTRSFKRPLDSPKAAELQLPTRKRTVDMESSSDEDGDSEGSTDTLGHYRQGSGPGLQSKPPAPGTTRDAMDKGEVQYLDLDHSDAPAVFPRATTISTLTTSTRSTKTAAAETDYKEIDFVKTQALTEMRKDLENKRKSSEKSMDE